MMFDTYSVMTGLAVLAGLVPVALVTVFAFLRFVDRVTLGSSNGKRHTFAQSVMPTLMADPVAAAVYFGLRALGVCILVGYLFSRVI